MVYKTNFKFNLSKRKVVSICLAMFILCTACLGLNLWGANKSVQSESLEKDRLDGLKNSEVHSPILINNNAELALFCLGTGIGTPEEPFIIEDLEIEAGGLGYCIEMHDTDLYLIIRNCTVSGANEYSQGGIKLLNCLNVNITECKANNNYEGIYIFANLMGTCSNNFIYNNNISNNIRNGIYLDCNSFIGLENIEISNNTLSFNGGSGVALWQADHNTIINNLIFNNSGSGTWSENAHNNDYLDNIVYNNDYNGISLGWQSYSNNVSRNTIYNNTRSGIYLDKGGAGCLYSFISENDIISNKKSGISYETGYGVKIIKNNVSLNKEKGLDLKNARSLNIEENNIHLNTEPGILASGIYESQYLNNNISLNELGIKLIGNSDNNTLRNNFAIFNNEEGFFLENSNYNELIKNKIWKNRDNVTENQIWDRSIGTFWFENSIGENADFDGDGLTDYEEITVFKTNHRIIDTDNDNFLDGYEVQYGSDPLDYTDYPAMPQDWYDSIYTYLEGNATLIQNLIVWTEGNEILLDNIILQLEQNATLLQTVIGWLGGNTTEIDLLFTYLEGNATLLMDVVNYLEENATLIQNLIDWVDGNASLLESVIQQLEQNATLLQTVIGWLGENATEIAQLFTYLEGNATLLMDVVNYLEGNATQIAILNQWHDKLVGYIEGNATLLAEVILDLGGNATLLSTVYALATQNSDFLSQINGTLSDRIDEIRVVIDKLGITIGDTDYDGLDDLDELSHGTNPTMIDTDLDNLNDAFEIKYGTDPLDDDTDGDGYFDGIEVASGTNPLDPLDYPGVLDPTPETDGVELLTLGVIIGGIGGTAVIVGTVLYLKKRKV